MTNNVKTNDGLKLIVGTEYNDILMGTPGIDIVSGLGGDDWIEGKQRADTLDGGAGKDTASYSSSSGGVTVDLTSGTGKGGDAEGDKLTNIENIVGSDFDDVLIGYNHEMTKAKGNEFLINTHTENMQRHPSVTSLANGGFVVTWDSNDQDSKPFPSPKQTNNYYGVFGQQYDVNGQKVGNEFQVNTYVTNHQNCPSVTGLTEGGFIVVWQSGVQDGSSYGVYGQRYDENGNKVGSEFQVNTYTKNDQSIPAVASLRDGGFLVVWESAQQDGSKWGIYAQRYNGDGVKQGNEFQVNTYIKGSQDDASVAGLAGGGFIVTWHSEDQDGSGYGIYGQRYDQNSNKVGSEFQVNTYTKDYQTNPSVTGLEDGGFIIIWNSDQQDGSDGGVYGQRYDENGSKVGSEFQVNTYTKGNQYTPSVTHFVEGGFIATWASLDQDGSGYGIYGQRYDINGNKIDEEFRINTHTLDHQMTPSVSSLPNAQFVVAWESKGQDNDYDREGGCADCGGIYGQLYETNRNSLIGGNGNDILEGKGGADLLDGGEGIDTVLYNNSPAGIVVNLASGTGQGGDAEGDILKNVENIVGTQFNDIITGDDHANILEGGGGNDALTGGQGADVFVVSQKAGNISIKDFEIDKDKIDISFSKIKSFQELFHKIGYQGGNTEITLDFHHKITLINVDPSTLKESQFIFVKEPKLEPEAVSEFKKVAVHIAKVGQADKIIIERDTRADQNSAVATDLEQCKNVILNFNPLEGDTIDLSYYGKFNVDQVSFTTFTSVTTSTNQIPVSGIKINGEEGYVACVYGFDADKFFAPDYVDPNTGAPNMLNPHDVITLLQAQNFHGEL